MSVVGDHHAMERYSNYEYRVQDGKLHFLRGTTSGSEWSTLAEPAGLDGMPVKPDMLARLHHMHNASFFRQHLSANINGLTNGFVQIDHPSDSEYLQSVFEKLHERNLPDTTLEPHEWKFAVSYRHFQSGRVEKMTRNEFFRACSIAREATGGRPFSLWIDSKRPKKRKEEERRRRGFVDWLAQGVVPFAVMPVIVSESNCISRRGSFWSTVENLLGTGSCGCLHDSNGYASVEVSVAENGRRGSVMSTFVRDLLLNCIHHEDRVIRVHHGPLLEWALQTYYAESVLRRVMRPENWMSVGDLTCNSKMSLRLLQDSLHKHMFLAGFDYTLPTPEAPLTEQCWDVRAAFAPGLHVVDSERLHLILDMDITAEEYEVRMHANRQSFMLVHREWKEKSIPIAVVVNLEEATSFPNGHVINTRLYRFDADEFEATQCVGTVCDIKWQGKKR